MSASETSDIHFFRDLKSFRDPQGIILPENFSDVPQTWSLVVSDIVDSTVAIERDGYKDVNFVGASTIIALINSCKGIAIPYVFGGDGANILVPAAKVPDVSAALLAVRRQARELFSFDLRVAVVPIPKLVERGLALRVAKYELSSKVQLAMLSGDGLDFANDLIKSSDPEAKAYLLESEDDDSEANLDGLECRWQPIDSVQGEILSVIIKSRKSEAQGSAKILEATIADIERITGGKEAANPVQARKLQLSFDPRRLRADALAHGVSTGVLIALNLLGWAMMKIGVPAVPWKNYKKEVAAYSDFWKFDNMLRFVIDVNSDQKRALQEMLDERSRKGEVTYGLHSSRQAVMTCLVFDRAGDHVHFVDGSDGGYALAAKAMKAKEKG